MGRRGCAGNFDSQRLARPLETFVAFTFSLAFSSIVLPSRAFKLSSGRADQKSGDVCACLGVLSSKFFEAVMAKNSRLNPDPAKRTEPAPETCVERYALGEQSLASVLEVPAKLLVSSA